MRLYYCAITKLEDLRGAEYLSPGRRQRLSRYLRQDDRMRCLLAGLLLRAVFGKEKYKRIAVDGCGKPYLAGDDFFSLSHSGDYVILAVAGCRVGVDIEKLVSSAGFLEADCLTDKERAWLSAENSDRAFFELWTGKESVMKATGLGFRLSPKSVDVAPATRGFYNVLGKDWFLQWRDFFDCSLCVAAEEEEAIRFVPLDPEELLAAIAENAPLAHSGG